MTVQHNRDVCNDAAKRWDGRARLSYLVIAPDGVGGLEAVLLGLGVVMDLATYGRDYVSNCRRTQGTTN
jgi:hypothetical protein